MSAHMYACISKIDTMVDRNAKAELFATPPSLTDLIVIVVWFASLDILITTPALFFYCLSFLWMSPAALFFFAS